VIQGITKNHHGAITVRSTVGTGTLFNIYLLLMDRPTPPEWEKKRKVVPEGNEHILLVDGEESVVKLEKLILERLGHRVSERISSTDALEAFKANPNDYDLLMTNMTTTQSP
jgi:hypothetical protein